jgi:hypothetical protein
MKSIDGIYRVDMLGPYGWERFSTAFIHEGEFRSASSDQYVDHRPLFGRNDVNALPIQFSGRIEDDIIDGEAKVPDGSRHSLRFRLNRMPFLH